MGAGQLLRIERLTARGSATLKEFPIPGGHAELVPVMTAHNDLGVKVCGWCSSLRAGNAQKSGDNCTGKRP